MPPQQNRHYTYSDYCTWDGNERWEIIDGLAYTMSPGPSRAHQEISGEIFLQLGNFLKGKPCKVFHAPFDVRLNADSHDDTVVQPDIVIVCDKSKLDDKCCKGAPDMVIEILSPSTARQDKILKFNKYLSAGVREYWIVEPEIKTVSAHVLKGGDYAVKAYGDTDVVPVHVLEGCQVNFQDVFEVLI